MFTRETGNLYGGVEIIQEGISVLLSSCELLKIVQDVTYTRMNWCEMPDFERITNSFLTQIQGGYVPGDCKEWLALAQYVTQFTEKSKEDKIVPVVINCGGRKINVFDNSNRYAFDYGTHDQIEKDLFDVVSGKVEGSMFDFLAPDGEEARSKRYEGDAKRFRGAKSSASDVKKIFLPQGNHPMYLKSSDSIQGGNRGLTYPIFVKELVSAGLSDNNITKMVRLLLSGYEPMADFTKEVLRDEPEEYTDPRQLQPCWHQGLEGMPAVLPALVVALFASETSRNPVCFIPSLMLLDLLDVGGSLSGNNMPITWVNCLTHPNYPLGEESNTVDPGKILIKIGGIHPMSHMGSFDEFRGNKDQLNEPLSWSHVKSSIIIIEWFLRYFKYSKTHTMDITRLTQDEYLKKDPENLNKNKKYSDIKSRLTMSLKRIMHDQLCEDFSEKSFFRKAGEKIQQNKLETIYPALLFNFKLRKNKVSAPKVVEALKEIKNKKGCEEALIVAYKFRSWSETHHRHFNMRGLKEWTESVYPNSWSKKGRF